MESNVMPCWNGDVTGSCQCTAGLPVLPEKPNFALRPTTPPGSSTGTDATTESASVWTTLIGDTGSHSPDTTAGITTAEPVEGFPTTIPPTEPKVNVTGGGLSQGAIIGISTASAVAVVAIIVALFIWWKFYRKDDDNNSDGGIISSVANSSSTSAIDLATFPASRGECNPSSRARNYSPEQTEEEEQEIKEQPD